MLAHGMSVLKAFESIKSMIETNSPGFEDLTHLDLCQGRALLSSIEDMKSFNTYLIYHDCGKPDCLQVDEDGKQHFPDHARISAMKFRENAAHLPEQQSKYISELIEKDMCFHALKGDELKDFIASDPHAMPLLLAAWASLLSNSEMFGGTESDSFKIKAKKLRKAGKWLFKEEA